MSKSRRQDKSKQVLSRHRSSAAAQGQSTDFARRLRQWGNLYYAGVLALVVGTNLVVPWLRMNGDPFIWVFLGSLFLPPMALLGCAVLGPRLSIERSWGPSRTDLASNMQLLAAGVLGPGHDHRFDAADYRARTQEIDRGFLHAPSWLLRLLIGSALVFGLELLTFLTLALLSALGYWKAPIPNAVSALGGHAVCALFTMLPLSIGWTHLHLRRD